MKLENNEQVQRLIADREQLRFLWTRLGEHHVNSRYAQIACGYFKDSPNLSVGIGRLAFDEDASNRIILGTISRVRDLIAVEVATIDRRLILLGVDPSNERLT